MKERTARERKHFVDRAFTFTEESKGKLSIFEETLRYLSYQVSRVCTDIFATFA